MYRDVSSFLKRNLNLGSFGVLPHVKGVKMFSDIIDNNFTHREKSLMTDLDFLALTLYGEDRGNPVDEGILYIAHVILNRRDRAGKDASIQSVVLSPMQFSCWNISDPNRKKMIHVFRNEKETLGRFYDIAKKAIKQRKEGINPIPNVFHFIAEPWLEVEEGVVKAFIARDKTGQPKSTHHWSVGMKVVAKSTHFFLADSEA